MLLRYTFLLKAKDDQTTWVLTHQFMMAQWDAGLTLKEAEDFTRASEKVQEDVRDMQEPGVGHGRGPMCVLQ
ncbi:hypothetical protein MRX96_034496 [Rhipicephalus microplus]